MQRDKAVTLNMAARNSEYRAARSLTLSFKSLRLRVSHDRFRLG